MPTYYAQINVRYPANGLECHGTFTDEAEARKLIEKELTELHGNTWERLNDIQYAKKDDLGAIFVLALLGIRYSTEEQERQELARLPWQIAELQMRLEALQKMYPPVAPPSHLVADERPYALLREPFDGSWEMVATWPDSKERIEAYGDEEWVRSRADESNWRTEHSPSGIRYAIRPRTTQPFDWRSYLLHQAAHAESEGEPLYDTDEIGLDEVASLNRLVDEGLLEVLDAPALCEGCDPFWIVTPAGLARLRDGVKQPPKPIKLRRKFDSRLRKAIRGWAGSDEDFEHTMDDLTVDTTDDEWDVIVAVFDALNDEHKKGALPIQHAYEIANEVRAKLAKDGAL